jgi:hypothetical protein
MNHNKRKKELSDTIPASLLTEMALPRMSKSARIAEQNLEAARIRQPRTVIPGTVEKLIPSPPPNQPEKAQIAVEGDHGYRDLRIENSLTDEHGDEVKLKKGAHVEVAVAARPDVVKRQEGPMNNPEKTYDWQQPYTAAIWETDNLLMEGRIGEALSAVEERRLSPVQVGSDEGHALAEADAGIQSLITQRPEKGV